MTEKMNECQYCWKADDDQHRSNVQQIISKSTDCRASRRTGRVSLSYVYLHCHRHQRDDYKCNWSCGGQHRVFVVQDTADPSEAKVFRAHATSQGARENLASALKLLATQQPRGHDLRRSRDNKNKFTKELRRFIEVGNHEAMEIGDPEKNMV